MRASGSRTETSSGAACPGQQGGSVDNSAETSLTMGTQGPGRKRIPNREKLTAEDDALNQIAREAEARLAVKRAARAEAREIRMKELEKQQKEMSDDEERMSVGSRGSLKPSDYGGFLGSGSRASSRASSARASPVVEERTDREFLDKGSRTASTLSAATLASLGGASSRRGSCDTSFSVETEASIREIKDSLVEAEEKYRRAMVSNAQLHNDKTTLMYQMETLREELSDMEELLWEARRRCDDTNKEFEREHQAHSVLQFHFKEMKETLRHTEELLTKHGVVVSPDLTTNGNMKVGVAEDDVSEESASLLAQESLHGSRESMLGKTREWRPAEGRKRPQNDVKYNHCRVYERSQSPNTISMSNHTRQTRKRLNAAEKSLSRNEQPKNKADEKDPTKKFSNGVDENLLRNEGVKKQTMKKCVKKVIPVRKASNEKVLKSRLIPPRPANDIILDNKAIVLSLLAAGKLNYLSEVKQEADGSGVLEKEAPSPEKPTCTSTPDEKDGTMSSRGRSSEEGASDLPAEHKTHDIRTAGNSWKEKDSANERVPNTEFEGGEDVIIKKEEPKVDDSTPEEDQRIHEPGPEEMWTCLEGVVKGTLQLNNQGLVAEMSRIFSEILISLHQWTSDLENTLQHASIHHDGGGKESTSRVMDPRLSAEAEMSQTDVTKQYPKCVEVSERVSSPSGMLEESTGSTSKVCSAVQNPPTKDVQQRDPELDTESRPEEPGANPADAVVESSSEEFVFIESYFAEPLRTTTMESSSDLGSVGSPSEMTESQSYLVDSVKEPKELKRSQTVSSRSRVGQSSKVRRLIEETAEEIKAMAVPELVLLRLQEGRPLAESSRSNAGSLEELSAVDMDSCEEAGEEEVLQQTATGDV